jgi:Caspase domain
VDGRPTRAAVEAGFRWLRGARSADTVVVFLAGHGKAHADALSDDYYYVLTEAGSFGEVADPALRARRTWSGRELADALALVPALKRVVILDTCESGKAGALPLAAARDISSDAVRAHARARERTGAWFLAGAAADQPSYEATRFGQGLLTYTLLEAMQGPALDGASQVLVSRLFAYAEDQVPDYARGIGGVQQPYVRAGEGDFPLGELPPDARSSIPIGRERAAVVRALVVGEGGTPDRLGVAAAIDRRLRALAASPDARFVWIDADAFDPAWEVTGQYGVGTDGIRFQGFLSSRTGGEERRVPLAATGRDAEAVAGQIAAEVAEGVR